MPSRPSVLFHIYRDGIWANDPDADDESGTTDTLDLVSYIESAGAERLDTAILIYKEATLDDLSISALLGNEIEIVRAQTGEVVHWGKIGAIQPVLMPEGETLQLVSRTEKWHLGARRVDGIYVWNPVLHAGDSEWEDPDLGGYTLIDHDLVFNPEIDGVVYGNLNDTRTTLKVDDEEVGHPLFLNPESVRTAPARELQGADVEMWPLWKAVHYLLWSLNNAETYFRNPDQATLEAMFNPSDDLLKNSWNRRGNWLPEALDELLVPLGYSWTTTRDVFVPFDERDPEDPPPRSIRFFRRGDAGDTRWVYHQQAGSVLDLTAQNLQKSATTYDIGRLANKIVIRGGVVQFEVTTELAKAWPTSQDTLSEELLASDAEGFSAVRNVYRKFVLNEAGDYNGLRPELEVDSMFFGMFTEALQAALMPTPTQISEDGYIWLYNSFVPRRRKLLPMLTLGDDGAPLGESRGVELEISNPDYDSENPTLFPEWLPFKGPEILQHEAGVYITTERIPEEIMRQGADVRVRATFTLQSDYLATGQAEPLVGSPQADDVEVVVTAPTRFNLKLRLPQLSKYAGTSQPSRAVDDRTELTAFAEYVRDIWDAMDVGGPLQLEGLDAFDLISETPYKIGDRIQGIYGKNVSFEARTSSGMYPQIVAIERNISTQTTTLHLQRFTSPLGFFGNQRDTRTQRRALA